MTVQVQWKKKTQSVCVLTTWDFPGNTRGASLLPLSGNSPGSGVGADYGRGYLLNIIFSLTIW